jgi:GT2 family glycosyltransferase
VAASGPIELSVVIPTRGRRDLLMETLRRIDADSPGPAIEVVVVSDGSADGTTESVRALATGSGFELTLLEEPARGPAGARNRGIVEARGAACLFLGDDVRPRPGLVERHLRFHRERPEREAALLGRVVPAPPLDRSPFMCWLHEGGVQFGYAALSPGRPVPPEDFWTANVSAKTDLLREARGFDERFEGAACEDAELGVRLARAGMTLSYDPDAVGEHDHPADLAGTLERMAAVGHAYRLLGELAPELAMPRRSGRRHRLRAAVLTALYVLPRTSLGTREAAWRFLCDQVQRETMWGEDGDEEAEGEPAPPPRTGARLARLALADPLASGAPAPAPEGEANDS